MDHTEIRDLKKRIKGGSMGAFSKLVEWLLSESQVRYNDTLEDHRYHQSRVQALSDILRLLPDTSK